MLLVNVDNVGSKQMQQIRIELRGKAVILMGKNTTIRKAIRGNVEQNPQLEKLLPHIKGNVGFVFTNDDLQDIREIIVANQVSFSTKLASVGRIPRKIFSVENFGPGYTQMRV